MSVIREPIPQSDNFAARRSNRWGLAATLLLGCVVVGSIFIAAGGLEQVQNTSSSNSTPTTEALPTQRTRIEGTARVAYMGTPTAPGFTPTAMTAIKGRLVYPSPEVLATPTFVKQATLEPTPTKRSLFFE